MWLWLTLTPSDIQYILWDGLLLITVPHGHFLQFSSWTNLWALAIEVNVQESGDKAGQSLWSFIVSVGCCRHAYFMHISSVMEAWEGLIMLRCFADTSLGYIRDPCCNFIAECYLHNQKVSLKSFIFICHAMHECIWQQEKTKTKQLSQCFFLKVKLECVFPRQIQWAVVQ